MQPASSNAGTISCARSKATLTLSDLQVPVIIGVHPHEKITDQILIISLTFSYAIERAADSDDLSYAIDYTKIRTIILDFARQSSYELLEAFSANLMKHLISTIPIQHLKLSITKKPADMPDISGVTLILEQ